MDLADQLPAAARLGAAAFVIGFTGAMAPGPLLSVAIAETCRRGWRAMFLMAGHALLEVVLLIGFAFGLQRVLRLSGVSLAMAIAGGGFLLWMGGSLLWDAARGTLKLPESASADESRFGPALRGALVSLSNPYWTIWWATIGIKLAADGLAIGPIGVVAFFIGHELADVTWYGFVVGTVAGGRHLMSPRIYRGVMATCAVLLLFLGSGFAWSALVKLLPR